MNLALFILAALVAFALIAILLRSPLVALFIDAPDHRKLHQHLVPRMGGFGIILTFWAGLFFTPPHLLTTILGVSALVFMVLGLLDDSSLPRYIKGLQFLHSQATRHSGKFDLRVRYKVFLEVCVAAGTVYALKLVPAHIYLSGVGLSTEYWGFPFFTLLLLIITNAYNLIDGVDGLAGSLALISLLALAVVGYVSGIMPVTLGSLLVMATVLGFLPHNISPAHVYLGDMGSLFLGYCIAVFSLVIFKERGPDGSVMLPVLLAGLPLMDVVIAIVRRFRNVPVGSSFKYRLGQIVSPDTNHLHHRLLYMGLSPIRVSLVLCGFSALILTGALGFVILDFWLRWALFAYISAALLVLTYSIYYRERWSKHLKNFTRFLYNRGRPRIPLAVITPHPDTLEALQRCIDHPFELTGWTREDMVHRKEQQRGIIIERLPEETEAQFCSRITILLEHFSHPVGVVGVSETSLFKHCEHLQDYQNRLVFAKNPLDVWTLMAQMLDKILGLQTYSTLVKKKPAVELKGKYAHL